MFAELIAGKVENNAAGADLFLQKPIRKPVLLGIAKKYTSIEKPDKGMSI